MNVEKSNNVKLLESGLNKLKNDLEKAKNFLLDTIKNKTAPIRVFTHLDADGLASGAVLGKALYRIGVPFQISVLRQLEREEIDKIADYIKTYENFIIFSDFGSGQYLELQEKLRTNSQLAPFLILDHHIPQNIANKDQIEKIEEVHAQTTPWQINPYFYGFDGSIEISGAGMCYLFATQLEKSNLDLSPIAIVGAVGDIQNKGPNKDFIGINVTIMTQALEANLLEISNDLNFSSIKPINEAIAYSTEMLLPGLTSDPNKTLKFLQTLGILMEKKDGTVKTLFDLTKDEKQKITSALIEYASIKTNLDPNDLVQKLIVKKYLLKKESIETQLYDANEFSNLLNACGRTDNGSLGIAIAMGDRKNAYQQAQKSLVNYKQLLVQALNWIFSGQKMQQRSYIQFFFGEDIIPENVIGTIASMLVFDNTDRVDKSKPILGLAKRLDENVFKVSARAHEQIVNQGVNLSEALREACRLSNIDVLGGGHPPAAGTKVPIDKIDLFLENCNKVIEQQLRKLQRS